jgi:nitrate reductase gamma subunit
VAKPQRPIWQRPAPYGAPESVQSSGTIAAPLLAGFTITLMGVVVDVSNDGIRHRDTALLILMAAVTSLLAAIQCAYSARRYMVLPDELTSWWPGALEEGHESTLRQAQNEQLAHRLLHELWARRFRLTYHAGIVLILVGLAVVLIPPEPKRGDVTAIRWLAVCLAAAAAAGELIWIGATSFNRRTAKRRIGRLVVSGARRLVPPYEVRVVDARASLDTRRLRVELMDLRLNPGVRRNLSDFLASAGRDFERGRRRDGWHALRLFEILALFQQRFESSGLSQEKATELIAEARAIRRESGEPGG